MDLHFRNHLDLEACVWLEDYLSTYKKILIVISHSQVKAIDRRLSKPNKIQFTIHTSLQDFLNGVCTDMMVMQQEKLRYWSGNYDSYLKTRTEQETNQVYYLSTRIVTSLASPLNSFASQLKSYKKQQEEIAEIKTFISSCGTYANLVRQAKSRQKILDKMEEAGLIEMPFEEPLFRFKFPDAGVRVYSTVDQIMNVVAHDFLSGYVSSTYFLLRGGLLLLRSKERLPLQEHQVDLLAIDRSMLFF